MAHQILAPFLLILMCLPDGSFFISQKMLLLFFPPLHSLKITLPQFHVFSTEVSFIFCLLLY